MTALSNHHDSEVLEARTRALAQPDRSEGRQDGKRLLVAAVGSTTLAFDVRRISRVLDPAPLARLPAGDHVVVGLRNVSGELLAVADIASLLGLATSSAVDARSVIVLDGPGGPVGVMVDGVEDLVVATGETTESSAAVETRGLVAEATIEGHLLVDTDALLTHPSLRIGRGAGITHEEDTA